LPCNRQYGDVRKCLHPVGWELFLKEHFAWNGIGKKSAKYIGTRDLEYGEMN
jgi:hypothetical protein